MTLRVYGHFATELPKMDKTQDENYHGGWEQDELAALISLCLGIRVKAGEMNRTFGRGADLVGRPHGSLSGVDPDVSLVTPERKTPILPDATSSRNLEDAKIISTLPMMSHQSATALIRASRMYQEAIWNVEVTPEISWLLLISAVETIANKWQTTAITNVEKLISSKPKLVEILKKHGGDALVFEVAEELAPTLAATKTFINFIIAFMPPEPPSRPNTFAQVTWTKSKLKNILSQVYNYRSRALHGGHPFPAPMCLPATMIDRGIYAEFPIGIATATKGGVWRSEDTPISFHIFEYIARNAVLNWWKHAASENESTKYAEE